MAHRIWEETKQPPGTAGPGNMLGCCLVSFHFLWAILSTSTVVNDLVNLQVDKAEPDFPRPAGFWWFGCSSIDQGILFPTVSLNAEDDSNPFPTAVETQTDTASTQTVPSMIVFGEGR